MATYYGVDGQSHSTMKFFDKNEGVINVPIKAGDERTAENVGSYFNAIGRYLEGNQAARYDIERLRGLRFGEYELETDVTVIEMMAQAGEIDFVHLYDEWS